jgi:hypothetical protein
MFDNLHNDNYMGNSQLLFSVSKAWRVSQYTNGWLYSTAAGTCLPLAALLLGQTYHMPSQIL